MRPPPHPEHATLTPPGHMPLQQQAPAIRRWSINGRFATQSPTGVQRYAAEILRALDELLDVGHRAALGLELELLVPGNVQARLQLGAIAVRRVGRLTGHAWEQLDLPRHVQGGLISLCNTGPLAVGKQIVCIHDVNTRTYPTSYTLPFRVLYRGLHPALGHRVAAVATVSQYSARQLARYDIALADKITIIPNGHEHVKRWMPRHSAATLEAAGSKTVVVIGSRAPHKNVDLLLALAPQLARSGIRIAVVGARDTRVFAPAHGDKESSEILWLGRLSDSELAALLRDALCLAFPSFEEGFGLPPLEAMALGCPVVTSDRASMPEICADAALFASPEEPKAWLEQILRLSSDADLRADLVARGQRRAQFYSWRQSAFMYLDAMARLDDVHASSERARSRRDGDVPSA